MKASKFQKFEMETVERSQIHGAEYNPRTISADAKTPHQAVITAMDAAGKLGFSHLRITTVEAEAKP